MLYIVGKTYAQDQAIPKMPGQYTTYQLSHMADGLPVQIAIFASDKHEDCAPHCHYFGNVVWHKKTHPQSHNHYLICATDAAGAQVVCEHAVAKNFKYQNGQNAQGIGNVASATGPSGQLYISQYGEDCYVIVRPQGMDHNDLEYSDDDLRELHKTQEQAMANAMVGEIAQITQQMGVEGFAFVDESGEKVYEHTNAQMAGQQVTTSYGQIAYDTIAPYLLPGAWDVNKGVDPKTGIPGQLIDMTHYLKLIEVLAQDCQQADAPQPVLALSQDDIDMLLDMGNGPEDDWGWGDQSEVAVVAFGKTVIDKTAQNAVPTLGGKAIEHAIAMKITIKQVAPEVNRLQYDDKGLPVWDLFDE